MRPRPHLHRAAGRPAICEELIGTNVGDLRRTDDGAVIHVRGKGGKDRRIPIEAPLVDVIETYLHTRTAATPPPPGAAPPPGDSPPGCHRHRVAGAAVGQELREPLRAVFERKQFEQSLLCRGAYLAAYLCKFGIAAKYPVGGLFEAFSRKIDPLPVIREPERNAGCGNGNVGPPGDRGIGFGSRCIDDLFVFTITSVEAPREG